MCYACSYDPVSLIDDALDIRKLRGKLTQQEESRFKAAIIKQSVRVIEEQAEGQYCDAGKRTLGELRELQYRVSQLI